MRKYFNIKSQFYFVLFLFFIPLNLHSQLYITPPQYEYLNINQIKYYHTHVGGGSISPQNIYGGFLWPYQMNRTLFGMEGINWGGKVNDTVFYSRGKLTPVHLRPGKIFDDGKPDDFKKERYRIYKLRRGWETLPFGIERDKYEKDYNEWPVEDGAPWIDIDGDGIFTRGIDQPDYIGDEILWFVANDMDDRTSDSAPHLLNIAAVGLEAQHTIYGYHRTGVLGDVVIKKHRIINKGGNSLTDIYIGYYSSTYIGNTTESSIIGIDTLINLTFFFSKQETVPQYGIPPAAGIKLLQGPKVAATPLDSAFYHGRWIKGYKNQPVTSFITFPGGQGFTPGNPRIFFRTNHDSQTFLNPDEYYNYNKGLNWDGKPFYNPLTGNNTKYIFPGDPVTGEGWSDNNAWFSEDPHPANYNNFFFSTGPFNLAPFDTAEIVIALIAAQGTDRLNSVKLLKEQAEKIQRAYNNNFEPVALPPSPKLTAVPQENKVTLWWETNAEDYDAADPMIANMNYTDTTYKFEGYRIWQYKDKNGREPKHIATYDIKNGISVIEDYVIAGGQSVKLPVLFSPDEGLRRYIEIETDVYSNEKLRNGSPYYYGVTSYSYSRNSSPVILESLHKPLEAIPGREKIDYSSPYESKDEIRAVVKEKPGDGIVSGKIIDTYSLSGAEYEIGFSISDIRKEYYVMNKESGDTLLSGERDFRSDGQKGKVVEGIMIMVEDVGADSIIVLRPDGSRYAVRSVEEIIEGEEGRNVLYERSIRGDWKIETAGQRTDRRQNIDMINRIGERDIRDTIYEGRE